MLRYALACLAATSALAHAEPDRAEVFDELDAPVFVTGALVFGGTYAASALAAGAADRAAARRLLVPLAGPWLALSSWGACGEPTCARDKALVGVDGALQLLGVLAMIEALIWPSHHRVITRIAGAELVPTGTGFTVLGHF